jgi:hypothetical protein
MNSVKQNFRVVYRTHAFPGGPQVQERNFPGIVNGIEKQRRGRAF